MHKEHAIFTLPSMAYLLYLSLVTITAFISIDYLDASQSYWLVWTAMIFLMLSLKDTIHHKAKLMIYTWAAIVFVVVATWLSSRCMPILATYLFGVTALCVYLGYRVARYRFPAFIVNLFAVLPISASLPARITMDQLLYISLGALIVLIFQSSYIWFIARYENREWQIITLMHLKKLGDEVFSCLLQPEYIRSVYLYERRLHIQKHKVQVALDRLRKLKYQTDINQFIERKLERVYALLLDCGQLRFRVKDDSTLSLCTKELFAISNAMDGCFDHMLSIIRNQKRKVIQSTFPATIQALEDHYQSVLMVAAPDPLIFLLFISSLKALSEELACDG